MYVYNSMERVSIIKDLSLPLVGSSTYKYLIHWSRYSLRARKRYLNRSIMVGGARMTLEKDLRPWPARL